MTVITFPKRKYSINALDDSDDHSNKEIINQCLEWIVKIWDKDSTKPLFMFDLNSQVRLDF